MYLKNKETKKIILLNESVVIDTFFLYEFLKRLTTPFNETQAFKLGIIDDNGKVLKKRSQLKTHQEKRAYTVFDLLIWNLKKIIERLPLGKTKLASYAAALFLIKEDKYLEYYAQDVDLLTESFTDFYDILDIDIDTKNSIIKLIESYNKKVDFKMLFETPANIVGGGAIAGASPGEQPVVNKTPKKLRRKNVKVCKQGDKDVDSKKCSEEAFHKRKGFREFIQ